MASYAGGTQVRSGYYLDARTFGFTSVQKDGQALPGGAEARWVRVPTLALLAAAPALGGLFVVALPFIGFGVVAHAVGRKVAGVARRGAAEVAATVTPGWVPGEAHLTGKPGDEAPGATPAPPAADAHVDAVAAEIAAQRGPERR